MNQEKVDLLGIPVDLVSQEQAVATIDNFINTDTELKIVTTVYASFWYWATKDMEFLRVLKAADLSLPDGIGVLAGVSLWQKHYSHNRLIRCIEVLCRGLIIGLKIVSGRFESTTFRRVKGVDLVLLLLQRAEKAGYKVFFLGGWPKDHAVLKERLIKSFPGLLFKAHYGTHDKSGDRSEIELREAIDEINNFRPDILLVSLGPPFQEKWLFSNRHDLNVKVGIGVGATFDLLSGRLRRAPLLLQRVGLEWLWRLLTQPTRVGRILAAFPYFPIKIAISILKRPG